MNAPGHRQSNPGTMPGQHMPGQHMPGRADLSILPIDIARGLSILLVVSVHTIMSLELTTGQVGDAHALIDFARAFRVPAFFFIIGLFLRRAMSLNWVDLIRKRLFGLLVLFCLWSAILFIIGKHANLLADPAAGLFGDAGMIRTILKGFFAPSGLLMFIYLMMIFLIAARLVFALPVLLVLGCAFMLETARISTGTPVFDEFAGRFAYFYLGIALAPQLFPAFRGKREKAKGAGDDVPVSTPFLIAYLALWFPAHALIVRAGLDQQRGLSIVVALMGIAAFLALGLTLARLWPKGWLSRILAMLGARALIIVLVFTLPMAAFRQIGLALMPGLPQTLLLTIIIALSLGVSLMVERLVRGTRLARLFEPPVLGMQGRDMR